MVCLFHSDYGPADPAFKLDPGSTVGVRGWIVGASSFKEARSIGELWRELAPEADRSEPLVQQDQRARAGLAVPRVLQAVLSNPQESRGGHEKRKARGIAPAGPRRNASNQTSAWIFTSFVS